VTDRSSWEPATFDRLYATSPDPWAFATSDYERAKYAASLAALPSGRFDSALEVGCSIGVFTAQLAARCAALLAVDVAAAAVRAAAARCAGLHHVSVRAARIPHDWPTGRFDLIVLSEVLYFLSPEDVARTAALAAASLCQGGVILLVNWTGPTDTPCTGDEAAKRFIAGAAGLTPDRQQQEEHYRIDRLRAAGGR
jgi:predicted TPR repeat methyltransferase